MTAFHTTRRIEFADTDMARIVHFARFFVFMEVAEHEWLRQLLGGRQIHFEYQGRELGWPRARASCDYRSPARLGDILDIRVTVKRKGTKSITWAHHFSCKGRTVAEGEVTTICCFVDGDGLEAVQIPEFLADQLVEIPTSSQSSAHAKDDTRE